MRGCSSAAALCARPLHLSPRTEPGGIRKAWDVRRGAVGPGLRLPGRPRARRRYRGADAAWGSAAGRPDPRRVGGGRGGTAVPEGPSAALAVCGERD